MPGHSLLGHSLLDHLLLGHENGMTATTVLSGLFQPGPESNNFRSCRGSIVHIIEENFKLLLNPLLEIDPMPLKRTRTGDSTDRDQGKFHSLTRLGAARTGSQLYHGWSYDLINHMSGAYVKQAYYHVAIRDPHGNRVAYLRDFSSINLAMQGAREWIDEKLRGTRNFTSRDGIGTIPTPRWD